MASFIAQSQKELFEKGEDYFYLFNKATEALNCFDAVIQENPEYTRCYTEKAIVLMYTGNNREALKVIDQAIKQDNKCVRNYYVKTRILVALGEKNKAEECFELAEKLPCNPFNDRYYEQKSAALYDLNRKQEALECYDKAIDLIPKKAINFYYNRW